MAISRRQCGAIVLLAAALATVYISFSAHTPALQLSPSAPGTSVLLTGRKSVAKSEHSGDTSSTSSTSTRGLRPEPQQQSQQQPQQQQQPPQQAVSKEPTPTPPKHQQPPKAKQQPAAAHAQVVAARGAIEGRQALARQYPDPPRTLAAPDGRASVAKADAPSRGGAGASASSTKHARPVSVAGSQVGRPVSSGRSKTPKGSKGASPSTGGAPHMSEPPQGAGSSHGLVPKRCTRVGEYLPTATHEERHLLYGDFCLSPLSLAVEAWLLPASSDRAAEESRVVVEVGPPDTTTGYVLRMLVNHARLECVAIDPRGNEFLRTTSEHPLALWEWAFGLCALHCSSATGPDNCQIGLAIKSSTNLDGLQKPQSTHGTLNWGVALPSIDRRAVSVLASAPGSLHPAGRLAGLVHEVALWRTGRLDALVPGRDWPGALVMAPDPFEHASTLVAYLPLLDAPGGVSRDQVGEARGVLVPPDIVARYGFSDATASSLPLEGAAAAGLPRLQPSPAVARVSPPPHGAPFAGEAGKAGKPAGSGTSALSRARASDLAAGVGRDAAARPASVAGAGVLGDRAGGITSGGAIGVVGAGDAPAITGDDIDGPTVAADGTVDTGRAGGDSQGVGGDDATHTSRASGGGTSVEPGVAGWRFGLLRSTPSAALDTNSRLEAQHLRLADELHQCVDSIPLQAVLTELPVKHSPGNAMRREYSLTRYLYCLAQRHDVTQVLDTFAGIGGAGHVVGTAWRQRVPAELPGTHVAPEFWRPEALMARSQLYGFQKVGTHHRDAIANLVGHPATVYRTHTLDPSVKPEQAPRGPLLDLCDKVDLDLAILDQPGTSWVDATGTQQPCQECLVITQHCRPAFVIANNIQPGNRGYAAGQHLQSHKNYRLLVHGQSRGMGYSPQRLSIRSWGIWARKDLDLEYMPQVPPFPKPLPPPITGCSEKSAGHVGFACDSPPVEMAAMRLLMMHAKPMPAYVVEDTTVTLEPGMYIVERPIRMGNNSVLRAKTLGTVTLIASPRFVIDNEATWSEQAWMGMIVVQEAGHNPGPKGHSMTTVQSVHVENLVLYGNNFTAANAIVLAGAASSATGPRSVDDVTVRGCRFTGFAQHAIVAHHVSALKIDRCRMASIAYPGLHHDGVTLRRRVQAATSRWAFYDHSWHAIQLVGATRVVVRSSVFTDLRFGSGVGVINSTDVQVLKSSFTFVRQFGVYLQGSGTSRVSVSGCDAEHVAYFLGNAATGDSVSIATSTGSWMMGLVYLQGAATVSSSGNTVRYLWHAPFAVHGGGATITTIQDTLHNVNMLASGPVIALAPRLLKWPEYKLAYAPRLLPQSEVPKPALRLQATRLFLDAAAGRLTTLVGGMLAESESWLSAGRAAPVVVEVKWKQGRMTDSTGELSNATANDEYVELRCIECDDTMPRPGVPASQGHTRAMVGVGLLALAGGWLVWRLCCRGLVGRGGKDVYNRLRRASSGSLPGGGSRSGAANRRHRRID